MRKLLAAVVVVVLGCALSVQANLFSNPSFETAGAGGSWDPLDWSRSDGNDRTDLSGWGTDWTPPDGNWVMKLNDNGTPPNHHYLGRDVNQVVAIGDLVTFSFYAHVNSGTTYTGAWVNIGLKDAINGDKWFNIDFTSTLQAQTWGDGWVQHTFTVTNTDKAAVTVISPWIDIYGWDDPGTAGDLLFDSMDLTSIPEPMSAALLGLAGVAFYVARRRSSK
ncbi:MAG: PEP-CTERM sorting domain-containing protein [Kiritimatiellae bacterium]|nr:PEP-CTERM sorting domain-containing protein [Kiritimatiellia bacterium]